MNINVNHTFTYIHTYVTLPMSVGFKVAYYFIQKI